MPLAGFFDGMAAGPDGSGPRDLNELLKTDWDAAQNCERVRNLTTALPVEEAEADRRLSTTT